MSSPTVSVIVPNFNHAEYLPRCLTALIEQSVLPQEIIVIDDASTDDSAQIAREFARRHPIIEVHQNARNHGVVYGANLGLRMPPRSRKSGKKIPSLKIARIMMPRHCTKNASFPLDEPCVKKLQ